MPSVLPVDEKLAPAITTLPELSICNPAGKFTEPVLSPSGTFRTQVWFWLDGGYLMVVYCPDPSGATVNPVAIAFPALSHPMEVAKLKVFGGDPGGRYWSYQSI